MDASQTQGAGQIYAAYCWPRAPTYQKWVKLTGADLQLLHQPDAFRGQKTYFLLNHPIEHVYLIGTIVAIEHLITRFNKNIFYLELDDGSGTPVEVKIDHIVRKTESTTEPSHGHDSSSAAEAEAEAEAEEDDEDEEDAAGPEEHTTHTGTSILGTRVFETDVAGLLITVSPGDLSMTLHDVPLAIGTVLKAKGTPRRWRDGMQLALARAVLVTSLDEELAAWEDYARFAATVLARPWLLGAAEQRACEADRRRGVAAEAARSQAEARARGEADARRREWAARHAARMDRREARMRAEARVLDGNALDRPGWKPCVGPAPRLAVVAGFVRPAAGVPVGGAWYHELVRSRSVADAAREKAPPNRDTRPA